MALLRCAECRQPVSSEATACPTCGYPDAGPRAVRAEMQRREEEARQSEAEGAAREWEARQAQDRERRLDRTHRAIGLVLPVKDLRAWKVEQRSLWEVLVKNSGHHKRNCSSPMAGLDSDLPLIVEGTDKSDLGFFIWGRTACCQRYLSALMTPNTVGSKAYEYFSGKLNAPIPDSLLRSDGQSRFSLARPL